MSEKSRKNETYRVPFTNDLARLIVDLNAILARIEDRLDKIEALRIDYATTYRWEKEEVS